MLLGDNNVVFPDVAFTDAAALECAGNGAGTIKSDRTDSSTLAFDGAGDTFTSAKESKFAQLSLGVTVGATLLGGGSGTASKSINELSTLTSAGFPLEDAKLLDEAVLCKKSEKV